LKPLRPWATWQRWSGGGVGFHRRTMIRDRRNFMKISEVMTRNPEVVRPDATVQEAARKMDELNVGALPVCDGERLVGMITDRDITVRVTAEGGAPDQYRVEKAMSAEVDYCFADDNVGAAAEKMQQRQIRRLPVVDRDQRLVG